MSRSVTSVRRGSAPVTVVSQPRFESSLQGASITIGLRLTTEAGPRRVRPHPEGKPTPELALGIWHPVVDLRLLVDSAGADGQDVGVLQMRCPAVTPGYV